MFSEPATSAWAGAISSTIHSTHHFICGACSIRTFRQNTGGHSVHAQVTHAQRQVCQKPRACSTKPWTMRRSAQMTSCQRNSRPHSLHVPRRGQEGESSRFQDAMAPVWS